MEISRRTLVKGAAWGAPVVALAVASPAASASGGTVTIDFIATVLWLHHSTDLDVLVRITNTGSTAVSGPAVITLSDIPADQVDLLFHQTETNYTPPTDPADTATSPTPVNNVDFALDPAGADPTERTIRSLTDLQLDGNGSLYLFFSFHWPAEHQHTAYFIVAGSITFGSGANGTVSAPDHVTVNYSQTD